LKSTVLLSVNPSVRFYGATLRAQACAHPNPPLLPFPCRPAISKYAATLAGLYPAAPLAALQADEVVAIVDELWNKVGATSKDKPETRVAWAEEVAPKYLALLSSRLGAGPFFAGAAPGWADAWVYSFISFFTSGFFDHVPVDFVARHAPALAAMVTSFKASELYAAHGHGE